MQRARAFLNHEVLQQRAVSADRLCSNTGAARDEIVDSQLRNESLEPLAEQLSAERAAKLVTNHRRVSLQESPQAAKEQGIRRISKIYLRRAIAFARERENGVRSTLHA